MSKYLISQQKKKELESRLQYLLTTRKKEIEEFAAGTGAMESFHQAASAEDIKKAYSKGVWELQEILKNCEVIDKSKIDTSKVGVGTQVTLKGENQELILQIVSPVEVDPSERKISIDSPIGSKLNGRKVGEKVELPNERFEIASIS